MNPISLKSVEKFAIHFRYMAPDPASTPEAPLPDIEVPVDAARMTLSDSMGGVFTQVDNNNCTFVADATAVVDAPPRAALFRVEVDEGGVTNAFFDTADVLVSSPTSPNATRVEADVQVSSQ